jgi:hypothetical protein
MSSPSRASQTNGLAFFAAAAFAVGAAAILALDRVGAPDRLIRALGPLLVLLGLSVFGLSAINTDLASFLAARRQSPTLYGGLSVTAVAAGIAFCLDPNLTSTSDPPLLGVIAGAALGVAGFGPLIRRFGATWLSDVIATRFSRAPIRIASALVIWTAAALTAFAGYRGAVSAAEALVAPNRAWAEALVATVLALTVTPGGLTGLLWCAAASGGALFIVAALCFASGSGLGLPRLDVGAAVSALSSPPSLAAFVATALAVGGFFPFEPTAVGSPNAKAGLKAGLAGVAFCLALAALAGAGSPASPVSPSPGLSQPVAASLAGAAMLASALALAAAGVHGSSRALGVALADLPRPFPSLASARLARMRAAQLIVVIGCVAFDSRALPDAGTVLVLAMALSLALTTPFLALAAIGRVGPGSASVAMLVALAVAYVRLVPTGDWTDAVHLFEEALLIAAAAFAGGVLASIVVPRRGAPPTPKTFDPFADPSH